MSADRRIGEGASAPSSEAPKCDFCSGFFPVWNHPSADFIIEGWEDGGPDWGSADGAWAACETCHDLIMAEDRRGLLERSVRTFVKNHRLPRDIAPMIRPRIDKLHNGFWTNRNGEPTRQGGLTVDDAQHRKEGLR